MIFNAIVELGSATALTLGVGARGNESRQRPFGCWKNESIVPVAQVIELGSAAPLTLGFGRSRWETSSRPNSRD